jgi:hypothetical protein
MLPCLLFGLVRNLVSSVVLAVDTMLRMLASSQGSEISKVPEIQTWLIATREESRY